MTEKINTERLINRTLSGRHDPAMSRCWTTPTVIQCYVLNEGFYSFWRKNKQAIFYILQVFVLSCIGFSDESGLIGGSEIAFS